MPGSSPRQIRPFIFASLLFTILFGCPSTPPGNSGGEPEDVMSSLASREPCRDHDPLRRALFGDLHVHTSYSMDAYVFDTRTTPEDAYRFAKGEPISIAPLDESGQPTSIQQIDRPLDFAAVTDHAEQIANVALCTRPESTVFDTASCRLYRGEGIRMQAMEFLELVQLVVRRNLAAESDEVCGEDGRRCRDAITEPWQDIQRAAEQFYDRSSDCDFTTFVAYEYSLSPELSKVHRNIIFRNEIVLSRPIHALEEPEPLIMLRQLRDQCIDGLEGCDVLAIPHNPNLSDGRMFRAEYPGTMNVIQEARFARLRAEMEPVIEIMQIKGDSECRNGLSGVNGVDELCGFEKMRGMSSRPTPDCEGEIGSGALIGKGCVDRNDFARYALVAGLAEEERIGDVGEWTYVTGGGPESGRTNTNPGGLFGVYAEENARDAIFDAIRRRETFGTSGPRITPRFFGGWELDPALCDAPDTIGQADAAGVPMGSLLPPAGAGGVRSPSFLATALRDTGTAAHPGGLLERIQIVKGWVGPDGDYEQRIFDVAGSRSSSADLDLETCQPSGAGSDSLCGVWTDPAFDPDQRAVYYARVVEMPSCRWTQRRCAETESEARPDRCDDPKIPASIQERAWTSPIWYSPTESESGDLNG